MNPPEADESALRFVKSPMRQSRYCEGALQGILAKANKYRGTHIMKLKIVFEPSDEGGYTVYVPSLPGCISEGDTKEEALKNIKEAIELYLEPIEDDLTLLPGTETMDVSV